MMKLEVDEQTEAICSKMNFIEKSRRMERAEGRLLGKQLGETSSAGGHCEQIVWGVILFAKFSGVPFRKTFLKW